jgi:lipoprotein-releasing system ATP-binding protein
MVSIIGSSGAGKSTLLHILGTLDEPNSGTILFNNENITKLRNKALASFRNQHIGFVFQFHHLLPEFTAWENVCIPAWIGKKNKTTTKEKAIHLLDQLGLANRINNKPNQLSGGEQQRVAVARALINNPTIVFADEPTGNLDSANANELHLLFSKINKQFNQTFVIVTHNQHLAAQCPKLFTMKDGLIIN